MIKIIALDLDGTLLNEQKNITDKTLKALKKAENAGAKIVINTGRNYSGAMASIQRYNLDCDYIVSSGAELRDKDGKTVECIEMNKLEFNDIYNIVNEYGLAVRFCSANDDYIIGNAEKIKEILRQEAELFYTKDFDTFSKTDLYKTYLEHTVPIESLEKLNELNIPIYKIFICYNDIEILKEINEKIKRFPDVISASSFYTNIELTHIDAQKGIALEKYAKKNGCTNDEVMAFGDSMNDYSMLSMNFGYTVAMGNATSDIKEVSKYITLSNENDGIAYMIDKFFQ